MTGVLVRFGQGLGNFLTGRVTGWNWLAQAALLGRNDRRSDDRRAPRTCGIGEPAIWLPIALAVVLAVGSVLVPQPD